MVDFPRFNNADIDWYVRMPTYAPPVDPNIETQSELSEEEGATQEPTLPIINSWLSH